MYYYPPNMPSNYSASPYQYPTSQTPAWGTNVNQSYQSHQMMDQHHLESKKGNICAYAPSDPVQYNKLHFQHHPSDDYKVPHPKGWLHTMHSEQQLGPYVPYR
ncbi:hypothetical protein [Gracilibacillus lacisalsi]|uniref:hypothetical protein n=1 Tax=Gracilibacillus lacisalsi TaxID=393087 RepID=UPI000382C678|nr:hypothetical protein [Gracilibacillus lacisalsi]